MTLKCCEDLCQQAKTQRTAVGEDCRDFIIFKHFKGAFKKDIAGSQREAMLPQVLSVCFII